MKSTGRSSHPFWQASTARPFIFLVILLALALVFAGGAGAKLNAAFFQFGDIGVTKTGPATANADTDVTYTIGVFAAAGEDDISGAVLNDHLPAGMTFVSVSPPSGWSCTDPGVGNTGTVSCSNSLFPAGSNDTFMLTAHISPETAPGTFFTNIATVGGSPNDFDENDTASATTQVPGNDADISISKTGPSQAHADTDVTYVLTVKNLGPNDATNASFTDTLPSGLPSSPMTFVSFNQTSGPTWNCGSPSATTNCTITTLPVGTTSTFNFVGHVPIGTGDGTQYTNIVTVTSDHDPNSENDSGVTDTTVLTCFASQVVTTNADSGAGSLRQAVVDACDSGTISFDMTQVVSPINLASQLSIAKSLIFQGPGATQLTISGNNTTRIFDIASGSANVTINDLQLANSPDSAIRHNGTGTLTITNAIIANNGSAITAGGGININAGGSLNVTNSTFDHNSAQSGGGICNLSGGALTISGSTFSFNSVSNSGGGGGIFNSQGALTITNSTFSNNSTNPGSGAAIFTDTTAVVDIINSTISNNLANGNGGGIQTGATAVQLRNTIVAGNSATANGHDVIGTFTSNGHNLIGRNDFGTGFTNGMNGDIVGTVASPVIARLASLANNGGPTQTLALLPSSPALDAGDNCVTDSAHCSDGNIAQLTTDQRGFNRIVGSAVDIGAFESRGFTISATSGTPQSATLGSAFAAPLVASIIGVGGEPVDGGIITFTAPASGPSATLTGGTTTASVTIGGGHASINATANFLAGSYSVAATAVGATSAAFNLTNTKGNTGTTITSSSNPSVFGQAVTFTATVSPVAPAAGTPTGSVTFLDNGNTIGTAPLGGGVAMFTTAALTVGNHTITTSYNGDGNFNGSTASLSPQVVNRANTATTITATPSPSVFGQPVTFTATISAALPGTGTPTGTVTFLDGGNSIGTAPLSGGVATFTTSALAAGNHNITTSYNGDGNFNGSTGSLNPYVVNKANTTATIASALNPSVFGQPVTFTATISATSPGAGTPTGTVTFLDGGNPLGPATLSGGVATFTTSALTAGNHTVTAAYNGDGNFNASTASMNPQVVNKANTTTTITSSVNPSDFGQAVTFTATISAVPPGAGTPSGTVQFKDNGNNLGSPVPVAGGVAPLTTSSLSIGSHAITADFSGDGNFLASSGSLAGGQTVRFRPLIKFSQPTYSVNENGNFITIIVVRSGDTNPAVTVDYTTPDDSAAVTFLPCSNANGVGSPRCDFTTALGTLTFGPGDTSKTFTVLISQDTWVEGNETVALTLSNPTGGAAFQQPSDASAVLTIVDDDFTPPTTNAIDDSNTFVRQHYHDFLNREPDAPGFSFWTNQIESCGTDTQCRAARRNNVSAAFFLSIEFQNTGYFVYRIYKAGFGDIAPPTVPVPIRFTNFVRDTQIVETGLIVGQGNWQAQLNANKKAYALAFVQRPEFLNRYPALTSATVFVDTLNTNAGMVLSDTERSALIAELSTNPSDPALRADVLQKIAENTVLQQREFNRAFVLMEYFGYLRRNPDAAPESGLNFNGLNFWLNKLNQFNGDYIGAEVIKAFITSSEYRNRFGP